MSVAPLLRVARPIPSQRATIDPANRNTARNERATPDVKALALAVLERNRSRNAPATGAPNPRNGRATDVEEEGRFSEGRTAVARSLGMGTQRATPLAQAVLHELRRHPLGVGDLKLQQTFWRRRVRPDELERAVSELMEAGLIRRHPDDPFAFMAADRRDEGAAP